MFSFLTMGSPLSRGGVPEPSVALSSVSRILIVLTVVFAVLITTGWTTAQAKGAEPSPRTAALAAWRSSGIAGRALPDPEASSPRRIAHFFDALAPRQQQRLADRHPLVVGNLNGAPPRLRYRANRTALVQARETERRRMTDERLTGVGRDQAARRMNRFISMLRPDRQILAFDPTGPGRAAEVVGDLRHAERVSVVVPGVSTDLLTFERSQEAYSAPVGMARALHQRQRAAAPQLRTAVVAWADYTSPHGMGMEAATGELADAGAERLVSFLQGLPGGAPVTLLCHSYGSVVCARAADGVPGHRITDIAAVGSPGMRVDRVQDLGTTARVWAMRSDDDWIADVPHVRLGGLGHGRDPLSPEFGARRLDAGGASGHRSYFRPGTGSLANLAGIGVGAFGSVRCASSDHFCAKGLGKTGKIPGKRRKW